MDREQRNAAFRKIALEKLNFAHSRSHKLSSKSFIKLEKLDTLFVDSNKRLKSDTLVKVISEVNKLIAEINVRTELERSRAVDSKQLTSHKTIVQSAPLQQSPSDASALYTQKDCNRKERDVPVENTSKLRSNSYRNAEMDKLLLKEISQIASYYDADKCPSIKNNNNEERLALRYPRKKIDYIDQPVANKVPEIPSKRSTSPLYWRRDQIFSKPEAAKTYGEYKRQQQMAAAAERQKASTSHIQEDKSGGISGSSGVRAVKHAFTTVPTDMLLRKEIDGSRKVASVVGGKEATTSTSNNVLDASMHRNENSIRLAHSVKRGSHMFTTSKTTSGKAVSSSAPQSDVSEHSKNLAEKNTREIADKYTTNTDPQKKNQTKKKVCNRELNDIILGAVEYERNCRRKQENDKLKMQNVVMPPKGTQKSERYADSRQKLLGMQEKNNDLRIVLTRIDENDLPVARRTRSNSMYKQTAWVLHKPAEDCYTQDDMKLRKARRKSVDSRTQLETSRTSQTLTKGCKNRAKSMWCKRPNQKDTGKRANSLKKKKDVSPIRKLHDNSSDKLTEAEADRDSNMYLSDTEDGAIIIQPLTKKCRKANDNDKVHCQSKFMFNCCLCEYSGSNMVDHYVSKHPDQEVFISRVSPDQADVIRKQPSALHGKCVTLGQVRRSISCICFFCEIVYVLTPNEWIEHIARHTGEFVYYNDRKNMINVNSDIEFSSNHMYAHICDRCNFVQVSSTNMKKHLATHHSSDHQHVEEYIRFSLVNYHTESEDLLDASTCVKPDPNFTCDIVNLPLSNDWNAYDIETNIASQQPASNLYYVQEYIVKEEVHFDESLEEDNRFGTERNCNEMSVLQGVGNGDNFDSHSMVSTDSGRTIDMPDMPNVKPDIATIANDIDGQPNEKEPLNYDSDDSRCTIPMDETYFNERTKIKVEDALGKLC